jgi:hypothetical protein
MAVAVARAEIAAGLVRVPQSFSFPTNQMGKCTCVLCCHRNWGICASKPGFEKKKLESEVGQLFGMGVAIPSVVLLPASRGRASTMLGCGAATVGSWRTWAFAIWFPHGKLLLDEAEPKSWFLLIVGAKLDLSVSCCPTVWPLSISYMFRGKSKEGTAQAIAGYCSQEECRNGEATVKGSQQREQKQMAHKKKNRMESCINRVRVQQNLIVYLQILK